MSFPSDDEQLPVAPPSFASLLKSLRTAADLTQEELAERAGLSARVISDLERATIHRPRRDTIQMLADGLQLTGADRVAFAAVARGRPGAGAGFADADFPPKWANLPQPPGTLVGREREFGATTSLLLQPDVRLLTLTGPGGVGKTRLALQVALNAIAAFPQGVWFVELAPVADSALVVPTIAQTLGVRESGERALRDSLASALHGQRILVVLDNVEHLTAAAPALGDLLVACEGLTILATSRQPLHLRAEREYAVEPLALPDLERLPPVDDLARIPAVDLFVRRAEVARKTFALTAENAHVVAEIAVRLDGLPLAIELAAARVKVLPAVVLLERLEHRLPLLTGGAQDLPARQQTLRATLDWSYDQLTPDEQSMFRQLAVFAGGFTLEASAAVGDHTPEKTPFDSDPDSRDSETTFLDSITSLVDKSLVHVIEGDDLRFGMLETMREYGLERLAAAGEETQVRERHAAWCLALAEFAEPELVGRDQVRWFSRLETELDNLRAALAWTIERRDAETALLLASAMQRYWTTQGYGSEGRRWLEQALATDAVATPGVRAKALAVAALINYYQGDYERAAALGEDALALFRELGDQNGTAVSLGTLAKVANAKNDDDQAVALCEEALTLLRMLGNQRQAAVVINDLGLIAWRQGDLKRAAAFHEEALTLRRELEDRVALAQSLSNLGLVAADLGDYARAAVLEGESLELEVELGNKRGLADSFENLAMIAEATEDDEFAARLFGAAEVLRARIGVPAVPGDIDYVERHVANIRARLGEATLTAAWEAGRAMSLDEAIAYALERGWLEAAGVGLS